MPVESLRERIKRKHTAHSEGIFITHVLETYGNRVEQIVSLEERRERLNPNYVADLIQREAELDRAIAQVASERALPVDLDRVRERLTHAEAARSATTPEDDVLLRAFSVLDDAEGDDYRRTEIRVLNGTVLVQTLGEIGIDPPAASEQRVAFLRGNPIWQEYNRAQWIEHKRWHLDYGPWSQFYFARLLVRLYQRTRRPEELMRGIYRSLGLPEDDVPHRADIRRFRDGLLEINVDPEELSEEQYVADLFEQVRGAYNAVWALDRYYSRLIRVVWAENEDDPCDTPLPDDPYGLGLISELKARLRGDYDNTAQRLEDAVDAYVGHKMTARAAAALHEVPRHLLEKTLRQRGLMRGRGGNRDTADYLDHADLAA